jgi:hypothetical protein
MTEKVYVFVGRGDGVPGLKHVFPQSLGERYFAELEDVLELQNKRRIQVMQNGGNYKQPYIGGLPGQILRDCLERDIYVLVDADEDENGRLVPNERALKKAVKEKEKRGKMKANGVMQPLVEVAKEAAEDADASPEEVYDALVDGMKANMHDEPEDEPKKKKSSKKKKKE